MPLLLTEFSHWSAGNGQHLQHHSQPFRAAELEVPAALALKRCSDGLRFNQVLDVYMLLSCQRGDVWPQSSCVMESFEI